MKIYSTPFETSTLKLQMRYQYIPIRIPKTKVQQKLIRTERLAHPGEFVKCSITLHNSVVVFCKTMQLLGTTAIALLCIYQNKLKLSHNKTSP